jgi:hypothetical protein
VLTASGTTLLVPGQYPTIQAGINAASSGDTVLIASGTYIGTGNKNLNFGGQDIVVMSEYGPKHCIIDCQNSGRGAYFYSGETNAAVLKGITIKNGSSTYGGGINISGASPTIERCIVAYNSASGSYGGGIYITGGDPVITQCTIVLNGSTYGGAIYLTNSYAIINSCIIANNTASG